MLHFLILGFYSNQHGLFKGGETMRVKVRSV